MRELAGVRDELPVDGVGNVGLPVVGGAGSEDESAEERGDQNREGRGREGAAIAGQRGARFHDGQRELERAFSGTTRNAVHAGGALG